jgi:hypothetical protein
MSDLFQHYAEIREKLENALALAEKLQQEKSYLVNLLIQSKEPAVSEVVNKYLEWLNK